MPARHFDVLNKMLANACPSEVMVGERMFEFDLHGATARLWVQQIDPGKGHEIRYEINSFEIVEPDEYEDESPKCECHW